MDKTKENWINWIESNIFRIHECQNIWPAWLWHDQDQWDWLWGLENVEYTTSLGDKLKIDHNSLLWVNGKIVMVGD